MLNKLLNAILRGAIARRWLVVVCSLLISLWGVLNALEMPMDVFPAFAPPQVEIQTAAPGLSPEQVERQISEPIEAAVTGLTGVDVVRSASKPGLSMVQVVFMDASQLEEARQLVAGRLQQVRAQLPESAEAPVISPPLSPLGTILQYAFTLPETASAEQVLALRSQIESSYENALLAIPGVAQVTVYGGDLAQTQIQLNLEALQQHNVALKEVLDAASAAQFSGRGGIQIAGGQERLSLTDNNSANAKDLSSAAVVGRDGQVVSLGELAAIKNAAGLRRGEASFNGRSAVVLMINKKPDVDTPQLTRAVEQRVQQCC